MFRNWVFFRFSTYHENIAKQVNLITHQASLLLNLIYLKIVNLLTEKLDSTVLRSKKPMDYVCFANRRNLISIRLKKIFMTITAA